MLYLITNFSHITYNIRDTCIQILIFSNKGVSNIIRASQAINITATASTGFANPLNLTPKISASVFQNSISKALHYLLECQCFKSNNWKKTTSITIKKFTTGNNVFNYLTLVAKIVDTL